MNWYSAVCLMRNVPHLRRCLKNAKNTFLHYDFFYLNSGYINSLADRKIILKRVVELYGIRVCSKDDVAWPFGKTLYGLYANKYERMETFVACLTRWFSASYIELSTGKIFLRIEEGLYVKDRYTAILANMRKCQLDNIHGMLHKLAFLRVNAIRPPDTTFRI